MSESGLSQNESSGQYPTLDELRSRFPALQISQDRVYVHPDVSESLYFKPFSYFTEAARLDGMTIRECVRCHRLSFPLECKNCGGAHYVLTEFKGVVSVSCVKCRLAWSRWACPVCGTSSPYHGTVAKIKAKIEVIDSAKSTSPGAGRAGVVAVALVAVGIAIISRQAQRHQTSMHEDIAPTPVTPPDMAKPTQPRWAVASLGNFSDGDHGYQLELWRDNSSSGQVLGRILVFPDDISKNPRVGELAAIKGNGTTGELSFSSKLFGEEVSFEGIVQGDTLEGTFRSTRVQQPWHIVFRRLGWQYEENYESERQWSKRTAELLACCGPSATE